jgi:hypothetical protein
MKSFVSFPSSAAATIGAAVLAFSGAMLAQAQTTKSIFPLLPPKVSTVPSNGDVNPYGVAIVPKTLQAGGGLQPGDILVSNFNDNLNLQGRGTTIMRVSKTGVSTFYTSSHGMGLSAALGVLTNGIVLIGNLPTFDGTPATVQPGSISVLDQFGDFLGTIGTLATVDGPWGMAVDDTGTNGTGIAHVFVSNVLSGVISRFDISYTPGNLSATGLVLANGFNHRADPAALEVGPSGLAYIASSNTLLVANSDDDSIYEIPNAATANTTQTATLLINDLTHLHGPLDLAILPNGHFVVANSDGSNADPNQPSELVEYTAQGVFVGQMPVDPNNGGAFGLAVSNLGWGTFQLAAVDDNANALTITTAVVP